jgi:hypothetical protein
MGINNSRVAAGFKGKLTKGTLHRPGSTTVDDFGDDVPGTPETYAIGECIREDFSAFYRVQAGIPDTDVSILILLGTVATVPRKDDFVYLKTPWNRWHKIRRILTIDPAGASGKYQAFEVDAPE